MTLLFSAHGRMNRARFWLTSFGFSLVLSVALSVVVFILWQVAPGQLDADGTFRADGVTAIPYIIVGLVYSIVSVWAGVCLGIKRYHDLDKSGTWLFILLIPVIGGVIYFIQAGCSRGTTGTNRYGVDPLSTMSYL